MKKFQMDKIFLYITTMPLFLICALSRNFLHRWYLNKLLSIHHMELSQDTLLED